MTALAHDLTLALELADVADAITMKRYGAGDLDVTTKPDLTPVTEADTTAERAIRDRLAVARGDDAVVGEEYGSAAEGASGRRWIVDPIDGTKNYVRRIPVWATLIALEQGGELVAGVVSAPAMGRRWWAARGEGAYGFDAVTGESRSLRVSSVGELSDAQVSFAGLEDWAAPAGRSALLSLVDQVARTRSFGDFWAYMLLAEGAFDVAIDPVASLWDLAAVAVIVQEAGGRFSDLTGAPRCDGGDALATNGSLHDDVLAIIGRR